MSFLMLVDPQGWPADSVYFDSTIHHLPLPSQPKYTHKYQLLFMRSVVSLLSSISSILPKYYNHTSCHGSKSPEAFI